MRKPMNAGRLRRVFRDLLVNTPFVRIVAAMVFSWLFFAFALYLAESPDPSSPISSYGRAVYWALAGFTTAGIANQPVTGAGLLVGGVWMIAGSAIFFGGIVATVTAYFTRPLLRPERRLIETIEYNLEQIDNLTLEELDLLKETVQSFIEHVESQRKRKEDAAAGEPEPG
jgi:voltage-gated potassium channel